MKIAIPLANKNLCLHFGHCEVFKFYEVDKNLKLILKESELVPPAHEPGLLPKWIKAQGVNLVIAGGMGQRAQNLFTQNGLEVIVGVSELNPENVIKAYLNNNLETGTNACDH